MFTHTHTSQWQQRQQHRNQWRKSLSSKLNWIQWETNRFWMGRLAARQAIIVEYLFMKTSKQQNIVKKSKSYTPLTHAKTINNEWQWENPKGICNSKTTTKKDKRKMKGNQKGELNISKQTQIFSRTKKRASLEYFGRWGGGVGIHW